MGRSHGLGGNTAAVVAAISLLLGTFGTSACNMITGADSLLLGDTDGDDDDDSSSSSSSSGDVGGAGGMGSSGAGGSSSSSSTSSSSSSSSSGTGGAGLGGQGGSGAGPIACEYPQGPYGVGQGQTVPPTLSFQGYAPNSNLVSTITSEDFFDCDGSRGIDAVLIDTSQFG